LEASLTTKLPFVQYPDDGFLAIFGRDSEFYTPLLDEEDRVRGFALDKDVLIVLIIRRGSANPCFCELLVGIVLANKVKPEQASKVLMRMPTLSSFGEGCTRGEVNA
jgi:hypothetical protein